MTDLKVLGMFDLDSFGGHTVEYICNYYEGKAWHTTHTINIDGIALELDEYYSQAYIPFDKRDNEIATISIWNKNIKGISFGKKVTPTNLIKYEDIKELLSTEEPQVKGFKYNDRIEIVDPRIRENENNFGNVVGLDLKNQTLRVKYGNCWLPTIRDVYPEQIRKI